MKVILFILPKRIPIFRYLCASFEYRYDCSKQSYRCNEL